MLKNAIRISSYWCIPAAGLCESYFFNVHPILLWLVLQLWVVTHPELTTDLGKTIAAHDVKHLFLA